MPKYGSAVTRPSSPLSAASPVLLPQLLIVVASAANLAGVSPTMNDVKPRSLFSVTIGWISSGYPGQAIKLNTRDSSSRIC